MYSMYFNLNKLIQVYSISIDKILCRTNKKFNKLASKLYITQISSYKTGTQQNIIVPES